MRHGFPLFVFFLLIVSVCFSFYDPTLPSDTGVVAEGPAQIRENFRALKEDQIVDAGTLQGVELLDIMRTDGTNADSPVFPGAVTVTGKLTASSGAEVVSLTVGTDTPVTGKAFTVVGGSSVDNASATVLHVSDGTSSTPSISFTNDNNTGFYRVSLGKIGVTLGGTAYFDFSPVGLYCSRAVFGASSGGYFYLNRVIPTSTAPAYTFSANTNTGLGRNSEGEPSMVASGTEAMRWTATGTIGLVPLLVGTTTQALGYALTVGGTASDSIYCGGDVNALSFTDRSDAPADLAEAYAIIQSHEAKDGKVDHSKLHAAAWGRKFRVVETGKTLIKTREVAPAEEVGKATIEEYSEPEKIVVSEPDQQGRNLSMVISAQALVIQDLTRRLEALEKQK